jgi:glycosyltransferase 2 family protein
MIPVSINAIGVRESVWAFFFAAFSVASAKGVALAWLDYGLVLLQALIGGAIYAGSHKAPEIAEEAVS